MFDTAVASTLAYAREMLAGGVAGVLAKTAVASLGRVKLLRRTGGEPGDVGAVRTLVGIDLHAIVSTSEYFHLRLLNALSSLQLLMGTLKDLRMKILSRMYLKLLEQMCSQPTSLAQLTLLPLLELSFHFLPSL